MKSYKIFVPSILLILILLFSACFPFKPARENIIGIWVERQTSGEDSLPCGFFEFFEDGQFEAYNIPSKYFVPPGYYSPERIDTHGSWELDTSSNDPFAVHRIELLFSPIEGLQSRFERVLYIAVGGGLVYAGIDESVLFKKGEKCE